MDQRISFVTLAVADLAASRRFYLDGLGWRADLDVPGEVLMIRVGEGLVLSLWAREAFEAEVGERALGARVPARGGGGHRERPGGTGTVRPRCSSNWSSRSRSDRPSALAS